MKSIKYSFILLLLLCLTGCWDRKELEDQAYVVAIGIDKHSEGLIKVTYDITNPQGSGLSTAGANQKEPEGETISLIAPDVISARSLTTSNISRQVTYTHTKAIIVSEEFAKDEKFFTYIDSFARDREIRDNTYLIVCKEKASDYIKKNKPIMETRSHKFYHFMEERWNETGLTKISTLGRFIETTIQDSSAFLAIYATNEISKDPQPKKNEDKYLSGQVPIEGGSSLQIIGASVFKEGKMVGLITGEEMRIASFLSSEIEIQSIITSLPDIINDKYRVSVLLTEHVRNRYEIDITEKPPKIKIIVPFQVDFLAIPSGVDYVLNEDNQEVFKKGLADSLSQKAEALIKRSQKEFKADIFQLDDLVRRKFWTVEDYVAYDWMKSYPEANITVEFDIWIRNFGEKSDPYNLQKMED